MKRLTQKLAIITLLAGLSLAVSACLKKPQTNQNTNQSINQNVNTNTATTTGEIDTSSWKTYRNEEYGFEFKYPGDWKIIELSDPKAGLSLKSPHYEPIISDDVIFSGEIYLRKTFNPHNLEIIDFIKSFDDSSRLWPEKFSYDNTLINNYKTVIFNQIKEKDNFATDGVFIKVKDYIIFASYLYKTKEDRLVHQIFDNIILSIKIF